jgi:hypothetical protein
MITVQLQEADYVAAVRLHRRATKMNLWNAGAILCYLVGGGLFLIFSPADQAFWAYVIFLGGAFLAMFTVWMHFIGIPRGVRRRFKQQKALQRPYTVDWNDEKLTVEGEDVHAGIRWSDFIRWREDEGLFLIYSNRILFRILPKRTFPDQTSIAELSRLLQAKVGPMGKMKS